MSLLYSIVDRNLNNASNSKRETVSNTTGKFEYNFRNNTIHNQHIFKLRKGNNFLCNILISN